MDEEVHAAPVKAVAPEMVSLGEWTELLGVTQPLPGRAARISAAVEGRVLWVLGDDKGSSVIEGQEVHSGQVIAQLDDRIVRANRDRLWAMRQELEQLTKQAEYAVDLAQIEVKRLEELAQSGSGNSRLPLVSRIELEKARLNLKDARSKQEAVVAKQATSEAELQVLEEQLDLYTLRAPIDGRLGMIQIVTGQSLAVGTTVADVVDLSQIDLLCFVPPHTAARLELDQPARIVGEQKQVEGEPVEGNELTPVGKVVFLAVQAQPETGNVPVKVRFSNRDFRLRGNAVMRLQVLTSPVRDRLTIPEAALLEDQQLPAVVVVEGVHSEPNHEGEEEELGKARKLVAWLGVRDRQQQRVEILALEDPDKKEQIAPENALFVVEGAHGLEDGDIVKLEGDEDAEE